MSEIRVDNITDEAGTGRPDFSNGIKTSNINGGPIGRRNAIINGNFDIWQRGTDFTNGGDYTADRWYALDSGGDLNVSRKSFTEGQTDVPNNPRYYLRFEVVTGNDNVRLIQPIEDVRTFSGQQITISYWARLSSGTQPGLDKIRLRQQFDTSNTDTVYTDGDPMPTLTSSWQKIVQTITVPSISGKTIGSNHYLGIALAWQTDNSTNSYIIDFAQVQVELGDTATEFEHRSYGEELALCQRYFQKYETLNSGIVKAGAAGANCAFFIHTPVTLRATPSYINNTSNGNFRLRKYNGASVSTQSVTDISLAGSIVKVFFTPISTTNDLIRELANNDIELDAEL